MFKTTLKTALKTIAAVIALATALAFQPSGSNLTFGTRV
jgi:hypothetical protein